MITKEKKKISKSIYFFIILIIFATDSGIAFKSEDYIFKFLFFAIIFICAFISLLKYFLEKEKDIKKLLYYFLLPSIIIIFSGLLSKNFSAGYLLLILLLFLGFYTQKTIDLEVFSKVYVKVMLFLAASSLIVILLWPLLVHFKNYYPTLLGITYNLGFTQMEIYPSGVHRNYGIFWEPGVYEAYLNIAILLLFFKNVDLKHKKVSIIILILAVITTYSTTGYIVLFTIFLAAILSKKSKIKNKNKVVLLAFFIILLTILLSSDQIYNRVFLKLINDNVTGSTLARSLSIEYNIEIFLKHPFIGSGANKTSELFKEMTKLDVRVPSVTRHLVLNTNTLLANFSIFGLFYGLFVVFMYIKLVIKLSDNLFSCVLIGLSFAFMLSGEYYVFSSFFNIFMYYGIQNKKDG